MMHSIFELMYKVKQNISMLASAPAGSKIYALQLRKYIRSSEVQSWSVLFCHFYEDSKLSSEFLDISRASQCAKNGKIVQ